MYSVEGERFVSEGLTDAWDTVWSPTGHPPVLYCPRMQGGESMDHLDRWRDELRPLSTPAQSRPQAVEDIQENYPCSLKDNDEPSAAPSTVHWSNNR